MPRRMISLFGIGLVALGLGGCGDSVGEGAPTDVDMTKDYSPKIEMPGMSPKIQRKAMSKKAASSKAAAAEPEAPATPEN